MARWRPGPPASVGSSDTKKLPRVTSTTRSLSPTRTPAKTMRRAPPPTPMGSALTLPPFPRGRGFSWIRLSTSTRSPGRAGKKSSPTHYRPTAATWEIPAARLVSSAKPGWTAATTRGPWPASRPSPRWRPSPGASFACCSWRAVDAGLDPAGCHQRGSELAALSRREVAEANRPDGHRARRAGVELAELGDRPSVVADVAGAGVRPNQDVQLDRVPAGAEHHATSARRRGDAVIEGQGTAR